MQDDPHLIKSERIVILGDLGAETFIPWIRRHARKLGLNTVFSSVGPDRIELQIEGPDALIDAMEMGCSLGPIEVWVDDIQRSSNTSNNALNTNI